MSPEAREHSLDELARGLASGNLSRRKALKLMGAALLGGTLASIPGLAWAKPRPDGAKCKRNKHCASGQCVDGVCGGGACAGCTEPCVCVTDLISGDQACVEDTVRIELGDCNACDRGEVCVDTGNVGEVGCIARCPITACPGCPEPCVCVEDLENPGVQACVQPIARIEANCDACPSELPVCHGDPTVGEVGCSAPCP